MDADKGLVRVGTCASRSDLVPLQCQLAPPPRVQKLVLNARVPPLWACEATCVVSLALQSSQPADRTRSEVSGTTEGRRPLSEQLLASPSLSTHKNGVVGTPILDP